jgi:hypothetical protein
VAVTLIVFSISLWPGIAFQLNCSRCEFWPMTQPAFGAPLKFQEELWTCEP